MVQNKYIFDPYPLQVTMQRLAENLKARRLEKKLSTKSLSEMSGVPASGEHATTINFKGLPTDEDLITVGTNIRISRARCLQMMEEVREGTKELSKYFIAK